jgi:hypothetical protein
MRLIEPFPPSLGSASTPFQCASFRVARIEPRGCFRGWTAGRHALVDAVREEDGDGTRHDERVLFDAPGAPRERDWAKHFAPVAPPSERAGRARPLPSVRR